MKNGIVLGVIVLLIMGCTSPSDSPSDFPSTSTVWVVNSLAETLSRVDLTSGQVDTNAVVLDTYPNDIVIANGLAYVVNSGSNNVQIIDLSSEQTIGTIEILYGINPYSIALDGQDCAFVSNWMTGNVSVLDLQAGMEVDTITLGGVPQGLCATEDYLFVTDVNFDMVSFTYGPGHLFAYSLATLDFIDSIEVGTNPQIVQLGPDGKLHVVCTGIIGTDSGQIDIVDPQMLVIEHSIPIGGSPGSLAFNSQHIAYLGSVAWADEGWLLTYDALTYQIIIDAQNPIVLPSSAVDIACMENDHVFAVCFNTDELIELDENDDIVQSYVVGDGPIALTIQETATFATSGR